MKIASQNSLISTPAVIAAALAAASLLAACASEPRADAMPALGAAATSGTDNQVAMTGSRIPARRTEKMVSQVGGKDYRETKDAQPAPLQTN